MLVEPEAAVLPPTMIAPPDSTPRFGALGDEEVFDPSSGPVVLSCPSTPTTASVRVPCSIAATVIVAGFGDVKLTAQGQAPVTLSPGGVLAPSTACTGGATESLWLVETTSLNGRGFDLVIRRTAP
jgi:hypothetical protein